MSKLSTAKTVLLGGNLIHINEVNVSSTGYYNAKERFHVPLAKALISLAAQSMGYDGTFYVPKADRTEVKAEAIKLSLKLPQEWRIKANFNSKYLF